MSNVTTLPHQRRARIIHPTYEPLTRVVSIDRSWGLF